MKKKYKLIIFILILLGGFLIFLYFKNRSYDYEKEYSINKYKIIEKYNRDNKYYTFYITNNNVTFPYIIFNKYLKEKELLQEIEEYKNGEEICIIPKSNKLSFEPLCSKNNLIYTYNLSINKEVPYNYKSNTNLDKSYKKINISSIGDKNFLLFNYKGFYWINKNNNKNLSLFEKDVYNLNLVYQKDNILIVPDYNQEYYFNLFYLINITTGDIKKIESKNAISFDSIFIGTFKDNVYILDKREEKEYALNIKKNKIKEVDFQVVENNKLVTKKYKDVLKSIKVDNNIIKYEIKDNILYKVINKLKIQISNQKITKIIKSTDNEVYYLVGEKLYMYDSINGEVLLLSNFEWNFNNTNVIFIGS